MVRTRFAPSPTGDMHIANLRVAIINWLFTKQNKGNFLLRIEDTDMLRSKIEYEEKILEILQWMNIDFDDTYIRQSDRISLYHKKIKEISEYTYYCTCDSLPEGEHECRNSNYTEGVLRFKTPQEGYTSYDDMIFGKLTYPNKEIEDFALLRSDKTPTYLYAVVIDDIDMQITHVIRGEDHKTNTFKQLLLYNAFKYKPPIFGHLSMIKGEDGQKLSKRNRSASVQSYIDDGYLPEALFNSLIRLGWGYGNEEIIDRNKALEIFDIKKMKSSPCSFDVKKLNALSAHYLRKNIQYITYKVIEKYDNGVLDIWNKLGPEILKRSCTLSDVYSHIEYLYKYKPGIYSINAQYLYDNLTEILENKNDKEALKNLRIILTHREEGLSIFDIINALGIQEIQNRIRDYI